jgi:hypothetical protein
MDTRVLVAEDLGAASTPWRSRRWSATPEGAQPADTRRGGAVRQPACSYARRWNPQTKEWTVAADWCDPLAETLAGDGYRVIGLSQQQRYDDWARSLFRLVDRRRRFRQAGM